MGRVAVVAEGDIDLYEGLAPRLAAAGHECIVVNGGVRAFLSIKDARPDIVLLDLLMSEVSAFRLCRMIRKDPLLYTVPVMVISDAEDEPELSYCVELGADDYVLKPVDVKTLMDKVKALLVLGEAAVKRDPVTGMLGIDGVKRMIDHRLARGKRVAACYVGVGNLGSFTKSRAVGATDMAEFVKDLAEFIYRVGAETGTHELLAAYVGALYFVVMLYPEEYERFCKHLVSRFNSELLPRWKLRCAQKNAAPRAGGRLTPKLSVGVVHNGYKEYRNAEEMFKTLAEVYHEAEKSSTSSYLVCRRCLSH